MTTWLVVTGTVVTAVATAVLALVTFQYARTTNKMAASAVSAARSAQQAAESAVLQNILAVQPRFLPVAPLVVDYMPSSVILNDFRMQKHIPIRMSTELKNVGPGPAIDVFVKISVCGVEFFGPSDSATFSGLPSGLSIAATYNLPSDKREELASTIAKYNESSNLTGALEISCKDSLGYSIVTTWKIEVAEESTLVLAQRQVIYRPPDHPAYLPRIIQLSGPDAPASRSA